MLIYSTIAPNAIEYNFDLAVSALETNTIGHFP